MTEENLASQEVVMSVVETEQPVNLTEVTEEEKSALEGNPYFDGNPFGNVLVIEDSFNEKIKACNTEFVDFIEQNK